MSLLALLEARHSDAVFVPECSMGMSGSRRLDAWVLLKTWAPWTTIGYEIKTARSDFLRDRKWVEYLPVCHELYFVCPPKLIQPEEVPEGVGLMWAHGSRRLLTKRKAQRRDVDEGKLLRLMSYVLMSRTRIVANMWEAQPQRDPATYWRAWLAATEQDQTLGRAVSRRLRQLVDEAQRKQREAERDRDRLNGVSEALVRLGLDRAASRHEVEHVFGHGQCMRGRSQIQRLAQQILTLAQEPAS